MERILVRDLMQEHVREYYRQKYMAVNERLLVEWLKNTETSKPLPKHTVGPWNIKVNDMSNKRYQDAIAQQEQREEEEVKRYQEKNRSADGELLEVLKSILHTAQTCDEWTIAALASIQEQARAAIAKAEGRDV